QAQGSYSYADTDDSYNPDTDCDTYGNAYGNAYRNAYGDADSDADSDAYSDTDSDTDTTDDTDADAATNGTGTDDDPVIRNGPGIDRPCRTAQVWQKGQRGARE